MLKKRYVRPRRIRLGRKKLIIASGPVIVEDNKVLLNKHGDTSFYKFCGGEVREGEDLTETATRRAKEEMGIDIEILKDDPFIMHVKKEKDGEEVDVVLVHFLAERLSEVNPGKEIREWDWLDLNSLGENDLGPNIIPALKHFEFL